MIVESLPYAAQHPSPETESTWQKTQKRCPASFPLTPTNQETWSSTDDNRHHGTPQNNNDHPATVCDPISNLSHFSVLSPLNHKQPTHQPLN
jgi:hypothetical protein